MTSHLATESDDAVAGEAVAESLERVERIDDLGSPTIDSDLRLEVEHLRAALESRSIIGRAQGMLMAREVVSSDEAFHILRRASHRANRKVREIADDIVGHHDAFVASRSDGGPAI